MSHAALNETVHAAAWSGYSQAARLLGEVRHRVVVAGVTVDVQVAGTALAERLLPALRGVGAPGGTVAAPADGTDVVVRAWDSRSSGVAGPRSPWKRGDFLARDGVRGSGDGGVDVAYNTECRLLSTWHRGAREGVVWAADSDRLPYWEPAAPFRCLLYWALADRGLVLAHAGAVAGPRGGVLLVGAGGAGKSTTSLACVQAGWTYVADDYCALTTRGPATAHAVYGVAKVDEGSAALLPGLLGDGLPTWRSGPKFVIDLGARDRSPTVASIPIDAVVVPRVAAATGQPRRLPSGEGLAAFAASSLLQFPGIRAGALAALRRALDGVPVWGLEVGPDVERIPDAIDATLGKTVGAR